MKSDDWIESVAWNADGLVPAVAQDAASVFHFGEITIPEAKRFLAARGIEMRL